MAAGKELITVSDGWLEGTTAFLIVAAVAALNPAILFLGTFGAASELSIQCAEELFW
jgi:hypothetical protein